MTSEGEVLYYAACHDCPLFTYEDSLSEAEMAAERHFFERDHEAMWGEIHPNVVKKTAPEPERDYIAE